MVSGPDFSDMTTLRIDTQSPQASASTNSAIRAQVVNSDEECTKMSTESSPPETDVSDTRSRDSAEIPESTSGCTKPKRVQAVYFVQCNGKNGPIKIGIGVDPVRRVSELRIGCPYPMELLGTLHVPDAALEERRLHARFRRLRIHGEWFECSAEIVDLARAVSAETSRAVAASLGM